MEAQAIIMLTQIPRIMPITVLASKATQAIKLNPTQNPILIIAARLTSLP